MFFQSLLDEPWSTDNNWSYFIPHILVVSICRSLGLESFSVFNEVFLSDGTAMSMSLHIVPIVFGHYIELVGCYFSICVYLHIPKYRSFFIFSDHCWLMFIPLVQYKDVIVRKYFQMYNYTLYML